VSDSHAIVHVESPAQDPASISQFYAGLFGWQLFPLPGMGYIRFQTGDGTTGGLVEIGGPLQHRAGELLVYVGSDDIDGDLRRAELLGGKILVPKTPIPNTGWFGLFQDPAGNRLGLFQRTGTVITAPEGNA
jgi:predicted enzyme related to lactoylglutathione lyase